MRIARRGEYRAWRLSRQIGHQSRKIHNRVRDDERPQSSAARVYVAEQQRHRHDCDDTHRTLIEVTKDAYRSTDIDRCRDPTAFAQRADDVPAQEYLFEHRVDHA